MVAMSLNPRCFALAQISYLVSNISRKNYKGNTAELNGLIDKHGPDAQKHFFKCLIASIDFNIIESRNTVGKDGQQLQLLTQEAYLLLNKPNFVSILCYGFQNHDNKTLKPVSQVLPLVSKALKLSRVQEVVFCLGLMHSLDEDISIHDVSAGYEGGLGDVAIEVLHMLLTFLMQQSTDDVSVSPDDIRNFLIVLQRDFPRERVPVVLAPLLYKEQQDITEDRLIPVSVSLPPSINPVELAEIIRDIGYAATNSKQEMLDILKDFGRNRISPGVVARALGMMAQTCTGLPDNFPYLGSDPSKTIPRGTATWDSKVFATALQGLVPNLCWRDVIPELDYEGFFLTSPDGLSIIMTAFNIGCRDPFPIEMIYLPWVHTRGQLSWFQQALEGCAEFSFSAYPFNSVNLEPLKNTYLTEEAKIWCSLSLIDTLLNLAEQGHYAEIMSIFKVPIKQCPEVFFLGLLQCKMSWRVIQMELLSLMIPLFMNNHPSSSSVLNFVWHSQMSSPVIQSLLIKTIADWYIQAGDAPDHTKLMKILDIAQDLKMLPVMLKGNQFPFVIDLACWASKRKFLNLDIWILEKIQEFQEPFIVECIHFLLHRAPKPILVSSTESFGLSSDIVVTILTCLQPYNSSLKPEASQKLKMLINFHGPLPSRPRPHGADIPVDGSVEYSGVLFSHDKPLSLSQQQADGSLSDDQ